MSGHPSVWDEATPVNCGRCAVHGAYRGLICGGCAVARWDAAPPSRAPAPRGVYARALGAEPADVDPGNPR